MRNLLLAAAILLPAAAGAQSPEIARGGEIAQTWCSSCHQVSATAPTKDTIPGFPEIARRPTTTADRLRGFLRQPHGRMPNFELSDANINPLVAYILSLK